MIDLRHAFGFQHEPFPQDVPINDLFPSPISGPLPSAFNRVCLELSDSRGLDHFRHV